MCPSQEQILAPEWFACGCVFCLPGLLLYFSPVAEQGQTKTNDKDAVAMGKMTGVAKVGRGVRCPPMRLFVRGARDPSYTTAQSNS